MPRMRSMKPEYWKDQDLVEELPGPRGRDARLLYPGLWCLADEFGRLRGDARFIKGELFPYDDDLTPDVIDLLIDMLASTGRVIRYGYGKSRYLYLPKLAGHQRLEPQKTPSRLPPPPPELLEQAIPRFSGKIPEQSGKIPEEFALKQAASSREQVARGKFPARTPPDLDPNESHQAAKILIKETGVAPYLAAEAVLAIHHERQPRNLPALVHTLINAGEIGAWLQKAQTRIDRETAALNSAVAKRARADIVDEQKPEEEPP